MLPRLARFVAVAVVAAVAPLASWGPLGCGGSQPAASPDQVAARERAAVDQRLQAATWRLSSWRPDEPLEAMFETLLAQQYATMTVRFQAGHILADSPTVHVDRLYAVTDAAGPQFTVIATDPTTGVQLKTVAQMSDDGTTINFRGETDPWRGYGQLVRVR